MILETAPAQKQVRSFDGALIRMDRRSGMK